MYNVSLSLSSLYIETSLCTVVGVLPQYGRWILRPWSVTADLAQLASQAPRKCTHSTYLPDRQVIPSLDMHSVEICPVYWIILFIINRFRQLSVKQLNLPLPQTTHRGWLDPSRVWTTPSGSHSGRSLMQPRRRGQVIVFSISVDPRSKQKAISHAEMWSGKSAMQPRVLCPVIGKDQPLPCLQTHYLLHLNDWYTYGSFLGWMNWPLPLYVTQWIMYSLTQMHSK